MATALTKYQASCLALELECEGTSSSTHRTPMNSDHYRLKRCPGLVDHYIHPPEPPLVKVKQILREVFACSKSTSIAAQFAPEYRRSTAAPSHGRDAGTTALFKLMRLGWASFD